jgi:hypothetical protein|tara:strand:+ start:145 stop:870 length:726 start_codon:yes stop_codon:yes gene_type:complete
MALTKVDKTVIEATGTASATTYLRGDGSWTAIASAGFSDVYSTDATATYTVPTDITKLIVIITGAGGGGAAGASGIVSGGGHAATTVIARVTVVPTDTITIAIGAGGTGGIAGGAANGVDGGASTFTHASGSGSGSMSTITAPGGKGYLYEAAQTAPTAGTVGANNEGISILGGYGSVSYASRSGGATFWGGGGLGAIPAHQNPGTIGTAYGSGGGGGSATTSYQAAGPGANGVCFIMEYK